MLSFKIIIKESFIILFIAVITAFSVNALSSNGIALFGSWNIDKGLISANQKGMEVDPAMELDSIEQVQLLFNNPEVLFVDVRVKELYDEGHVKGAISMPLYNFDHLMGNFMEKYLPSQLIVTYCTGRECSDSHEAAQYLKNAGFSNVAIYIDGFPNWKEKGMPIE